jgi:hypothetical protein
MDLAIIFIIDQSCNLMVLAMVEGTRLPSNYFSPCASRGRHDFVNNGDIVWHFLGSFDVSAPSVCAHCTFS